MGRNATFSEEEAFSAARQLVAAGKDVSAKSLRGVLRTGSYSTLQSFVDAWRSQTHSVTSIMSAEVPEAVRHVQELVWREAVAIAAREVERVRLGANEETKLLRSDLDDALTTVAELEAENETDQKLIESLHSELEMSNKRAVEACARMTEMEYRIHDLKMQEEATRKDAAQWDQVLEFLRDKVG